jgi:hypothetical protein
VLVVAVPELRNDKPYLSFPVAHTTHWNSASSTTVHHTVKDLNTAATASVTIKDDVFRVLDYDWHYEVVYVFANFGTTLRPL